MKTPTLYGADGRVIAQPKPAAVGFMARIDTGKPQTKTTVNCEKEWQSHPDSRWHKKGRS